jgi:hypothetical protein
MLCNVVGALPEGIAIIIATALRNCASVWYNRRVTEIKGSHGGTALLTFYVSIIDETSGMCVEYLYHLEAWGSSEVNS